MDYDRDLHRNYFDGRALDAPTRRLWVDVVADYLPAGAKAILDLGCGTGRFMLPMMERFPLRVVGVDPSRRMLAHVPPGALVARATAERIPLRDGACDLVLLSMVIHHIEDLAAAFGEVARVLRPGGRALVRNCFKDRLDEICFFRYSPAAKCAENERMPSVGAVEALGARHGLQRIALRRVRQETDGSLAAHYARLQKRAMSTFALLTEEEIEAGLAAVAEAARAEREPRPVVEGIDLLVLEKG